jgi:ubiquinone/menaquinone biosynthesis C-methylase UbiE
MTDKIFDVARAAQLDGPERADSLPSADVVAALKISESDIIGDIGAGTGYFAIPMARVAAKGKVYAVDLQRGMLQILQSKVSGLENLQLVEAGGEATTLGVNSCDLAFYANVWHEFEQRDKVIEEAIRILKSTGRIAILDWRPDVERISGPPLHHRVSISQVSSELAAAGLTVFSSENIGRYSWLVQATVSKS